LSARSDLTLFLIAALFLVIVACAAVLRAFIYTRVAPSDVQTPAPAHDADIYHPMLRLLSDDDSEATRADRRRLFRAYVRDVAQDYGRLLASIRITMAQSNADRPDLARVLLRNRLFFAVALVRIDLTLCLHAMGINRVDVLVLVDTLNILRRQASLLADSTVWGS
jgi:hypothetical protein